MLYLLIAVAGAWIAWEALMRRERAILERLGALEAEVARLRRPLPPPAAAPSPAAPAATPSPAVPAATPSPAPRAAAPFPGLPAAPAPKVRGLDDTVEVEVPAWIRELPPPPAAPAQAPVPASAPVPSPVPAAAPVQARAQAPGPVPAPVRNPAPAPAPGFDWEGLVGVRLFSFVAGVALLVAAIAFLRYSIEHGWLSPPVRMAIGIGVGLGLLVGCETRWARAYRVTSEALGAAGAATLFATFYAASTLWELLPAAAAFPLMALTAAAAVGLAIRRDSVAVALLGLLGAFATPVLLASGQDHPATLFGYLALLNVGLGWAAHRRGWPFLGALSLVLTAGYQLGWVIRFLDESKLGTGSAIFLLFPVLGFGTVILTGRDREGQPPLFRLVAALSAVPPLLFALTLALEPAYGRHPGLMFGFLLLVAAGLAVMALARGPAWLHALGAGAVLAVWAAWISVSWQPGAWPWILGFVLAFQALYLAAPLAEVRIPGTRPLAGSGRLAVFAAPLLGFVYPALAALAPGGGDLLLPAAALAGLALCGAHALRFSEGWVWRIAAVGAVAGLAAWTGRYGAADTAPGALGACVATGLVLLGVPALPGRGAVRAWPAGPRLEGFLGLAPLLIVLAIAADGHIQPGPGLVVASLALLAAGAAAASLRTGLGALAAGGFLGAQLVLGAWICFAPPAHLGIAPWAALGFGAGAFATYEAGRSRGDAGFPFTAGLALLGGFAALLCLREVAPAAFLPAQVLVQALLAAGLLVLARRTGAQGWSVALAAAGAVVMLGWGGPTRAQAWQALAVAAPFYLLQALNPLLLEREAGRDRLPWIAFALASAVFFLAARPALGTLGCEGAIGLLPLAQAALTAPHVLRARALARDGGSRTPLALAAAVVLAFVTVAIPLQLDREWITLGWALLAAALVWLHRRVPHRGLLLWAAALYAAVFVRLALNPAVLTYHPRAEILVFNWYLYTYLVPALCCFAGAWLLARDGETPDRLLRILRGALPAGGAVLLFLLLNIEIADVFSAGGALAFNLTGGTLAEGLATTIGWGVYAIVALGAGVVLRSRATRISAIALLTVTVLKAFLVDLSNLRGLYQAASFLGLAVCLAGVAVILQRFVLRGGSEA